MAGFWDKLKTLVGGIAHGVLDAQIDDRPIEYLQQVARKAEDGKKELTHAVAAARAELNITRRDVDAKKAQIERTKAEATQLLSDGDVDNDHWAEDQMGYVIGFEEELANLETDLVTQTETVTSLERVLVQVSQKLQQAIKQIDRLRQLDRGAKASERATEALEQVGGIVRTDTNRTVDDAARRIEVRVETAKEKLKMQQAQFGGGAEEAVRKSAAAERLAALRAEIEANKAKKTGAATGAATTTTPTT